MITNDIIHSHPVEFTQILTGDQAYITHEVSSTLLMYCAVIREPRDEERRHVLVVCVLTCKLRRNMRTVMKEHPFPKYDQPSYLKSHSSIMASISPRTFPWRTSAPGLTASASGKLPPVNRC